MALLLHLLRSRSFRLKANEEEPPARASRTNPVRIPRRGYTANVGARGVHHDLDLDKERAT